MFKSQSSIGKLLIVIYILSLLGRSVRAESSSKPKKTDTDSEEKIVFIDEFDPPGEDKPKDTRSGGSRDGLRCNPNEQPIQAVMPPGNFGLTTKEQPNIYLYLPQTSAKQVVLAVQNEDKTQYQRAFLPIQTNSNIARFSLPKDKIELEAGKNYQWKISVSCGDNLKPGDPAFSGWIQRVEPTAIQKQLNSKDSKEQIQYFANNGYWYDLLDAINIKQPSVNALQEDWQQIFK